METATKGTALSVVKDPTDGTLVMPDCKWRKTTGRRLALGDQFICWYDEDGVDEYRLVTLGSMCLVDFDAAMRWYYYYTERNLLTQSLMWLMALTMGRLMDGTTTIGGIRDAYGRGVLDPEVEPRVSL